VGRFLFVEDAARAIVTVLQHGTPGSVYNIDSGEPALIRDLAGEINHQVGNDVDLVFDPTKPAGVPCRVGAIDKLRGIGFRPDYRGLSLTVPARELGRPTGKWSSPARFNASDVNAPRKSTTAVPDMASASKSVSISENSGHLVATTTASEPFAASMALSATVAVTPSGSASTMGS